MSILVRHAEKELIMIRDLDFKLNMDFIIGVRDENYHFLSQNNQHF
jgi:hypothetical protein